MPVRRHRPCAPGSTPLETSDAPLEAELGRQESIVNVASSLCPQRLSLAVCEAHRRGDEDGRLRSSSWELRHVAVGKAPRRRTCERLKRPRRLGARMDISRAERERQEFRLRTCHIAGLAEDTPEESIRLLKGERRLLAPGSSVKASERSSDSGATLEFRGGKSAIG